MRNAPELGKIDFRCTRVACVCAKFRGWDDPGVAKVGRAHLWVVVCPLFEGVRDKCGGGFEGV